MSLRIAGVDSSAPLILKIQWGIIVILVALLVAPYIVDRPAPASSGEMSGMSPGMMQKLYPLDNAGVPIPAVSFTLKKDALDGWDLHVITTNFTFTPQNINEAPVPDQGHVHLYIDGNLTVVMGPWFQIPSSAMPPGKHVITVSLNANDHSEFAYGGKPIQAAQTVYSY